MNTSRLQPRELLTTCLLEALEAEFQISDVEVDIERADSQFGDFQTNIALKLQKRIGGAPRDIATALANRIAGEEMVATAEVAGPGFVNVRLSDQYWAAYGSRLSQQVFQAPDRHQKVQVEFISANPTGPLTLGNARGGFIGSALSNVLKVRGYEVVREYYFNDAGTQIGKLMESLDAHIKGEVTEDTPYKGEYMREVADLFRDKEGAVEPSELTEHIFATYIKPALESSDIVFDAYTNERTITRYFDDVSGLLKKSSFIEDRDDALWLKSSAFGDERDRVLIKANGDHTYLANDIAYHYDIYKNRGFDKAIKIWGADHAGQVSSLKMTLEQLFPEVEIDFLIVQWVRLIKDGQEFKISKRAGSYVTVEELVDRVGKDVARWFMLMRSNDTHMDFDLDLASEQSQKNPYWYVMYAYVRLCSILREAEARGFQPADEVQAFAHSSEREMVRLTADLPQLLEAITHTYEVHKLTFYSQQLAKLFHEWYEAVRVLELEPDSAAERVLLLEKLKLVFETCFAVIGVEKREKM